MIRTLSLLGIAALCASCRTDSSADLNQTEAPYQHAQINARDDCLRRDAPNSLQDIALSATSYCSQAIRARLLKSSPSDRRELARDVEKRAFTIGLELRESQTR
jgi:hypothetical protein